ncbi:class I SAM-dependent methyltransferase [Actinomadura violacea]|uniref:Class I SAM-dependent methyltransferase n=1 Tax=Actinomadura violacea TaxID=2819934 RepID=A0ABS3S0W7_9ACTN|nr:class I SAM-dependent methyltransferase [Actinomadura violacea]MBO2462649.1 class I SAM-dependent methyltransferase [Actinomadura violacea]
MGPRVPDEKEYVHERLGDRFEQATSSYDTARRVETLIDEFLSDEMVAGKKTLDVGCGLGYFSARLHERGAKVTAIDLGPNLVETTRRRVGCDGEVVDALRLVEHFGPDSFDLVVSSECIEHTPDPPEVLRQMARVLKPGGHISVSTPNLLWSPIVKLATALKLRPFDGFENFSTWRTLKGPLEEHGVIILREKGLHIFPFQFGMHERSRWCDGNLQRLRSLMLNYCVLGQKRF